MNASTCSKSLVLVLLAIVGSIACDRRENHYAKRSDLGDAIRRGWIPSWVVSDATDIREMHDLDTNRYCGVFTFSTAGAAELTAACNDAEIVEQRHPRERPTYWWPRELIRGHTKGSRFRVVICKGPNDRYGDYAAIDAQASKAYFWWLPG